MNHDTMVAAINQVICDVLEIEESKIEPNKSFEEQDFDSLAIIEVVEGIEEAVGVRLDDEHLGDLHNVRDLYDLVWEQLPNKE